MRYWSPSKLLVILVVVVSFCGIANGGVFDDAITVKKARCYANCLSVMAASGNPDPGCHGNNCRQCTRACQMMSKSLQDCMASCAKSSICEKSCRYVKTVKAWGDIYNGDGSTISKPPIPIATAKNLTSLTLSWKPGVVNVNGSVVYLLKKRFSQGANEGGDKLTMIFTEPQAMIPLQQVCNKVVDRSRTYWDVKLSFYFRVVALTENSTLVMGGESLAIEMPKPASPSKISIPDFTYNASSPNPVILTTNFTPSTSAQSSLLTEYFVSWSVKDSILCQDPAISPRMMYIKHANRIQIALFYKMFRCNHNLKVYSITKCVASDPVELDYKYPGCLHVANFDRARCLQFDAPITPESYRRVRNLTYTPFRVQRDYRFNLNITWLPPLYPYENVTSYGVTYGNAAYRPFVGSQIWFPEFTYTDWKYTVFEMKNLLPNTKYKYTVKPFFRIVAAIELSGTVETPKLPANEFVVQNVAIRRLGFSANNYFSYNFTWNHPMFHSGNVERYEISNKIGNINQTLTTTNNFFVVRHVLHSQPFTIEIKPKYSLNWIPEIPITKTLIGDGPPKDNLTVNNLRSANHHDQVHNYYEFVISWTPPTFSYIAVDRYQITYSLSGYPYHAIDCNLVQRSACLPNNTKETRYKIGQVLPSEHVVFTVTPLFLNSSYVKGIAQTIKIDAPYPRRSLVAVRNLTYVGIHEINGSQQLNFTWHPPQFKHSKVSKYNIKYFIKAYDDKISNPTVIKVRRSALSKNQTTSMDSMEQAVGVPYFYYPVFESGKQMILEVTPVFDVEIIVGEKSTISVSSPSEPTIASQALSAAEKGAIGFGVIIFLLLLLLFLFWFVKRQRQWKNGLAGGKDAIIDQWEVPIEKIYLEDEIGEGAFGKVYKAILVELPEQSAKYSIARSIRRKSLKPLTQAGDGDGYVVAAKMLHDMADSEQRREFLQEINLMKGVGSHRNIVNMLGCGTLCDPMFLIVEYLPNGDLLHYLRKRRGKIRNSSDSDAFGAHHSTYCQTYFNKNNKEGEISLQAARSDRVYVHSPEITKETKKGEIQLASLQENQEEHENSTTDANAAMATYDVDELEMEDLDDSLTPGDLMAFAWQVSQGMEYLSKRGYVHRDLAARNVLVGNNKEAKIADFGLTRHMYENLYQAKTNRKLPLKWMSVEAIFDQAFTSHSDVWAYGVFLWELVTLGGTPYPSISNRELLKLLKAGYRMEKPGTCDDELYAIMQSCWRQLPEDRPTFEDVREKLEEMMTRDNPYFDPSAVDESRDYYNVPSFNSAPGDDDVIGDIIEEASSAREIQDSNIIALNDNYAVLNNDNDEAESNVQAPQADDPWMVQECSSKINEPADVELDQVIFDDDQIEFAGEFKSNEKNLKYAKLDFDDLEFQLYRRQNQGFVL